MNKKLILAVAAGVVLAALGFYLYDRKKTKDAEIEQTEQRLDADVQLKQEIQKEAARRNVSYKQQLNATAKRIVK